MYHNIILMALMSLTTALIGKLITYLTNMDSRGVRLALYRLVGRKTNVVTITKITALNQKMGYWSEDSIARDNGRLINAVMHHINAEHVYAASSESELTDGDDRQERTALHYYLSKRVLYYPASTVKVQDMHIQIKRNVIKESVAQATSTTTMTIESVRSVAEIDKFIRDCYNSYVAKEYKDSDTRYLFKQIPSRERGLFKRYVLNNKIVFESMYFEKKEKLISLADKLMSGEISKLALLLYGRPGCGKTSIIKSLANYLDYHVIEVKLSFVMNDAMLVDILHGKQIPYITHHSTATNPEIIGIPLDKRIYIFEDIDAECLEVKTRASEPPEIDIKPADTKGADNSAMDERYKRMMDKWMMRKVTLSGILNALDGILEINGSVIIMTTNHRERLDPALIRPGRITMELEMTEMTTMAADAMIEDRFGRQTKPSGVLDMTLTPATLESFCQAAESADELRTMIRDHYAVLCSDIH